MPHMKKLFLLLLLIIFGAQSATGHVLEELWNKYSEKSRPAKAVPAVSTPGKILGKAQGTGEAAFRYPWKYRFKTYELHFEDPAELAQFIYSLAVFAHDVSPDLPKEKFYGGVLGFHYSARQIADWLNAAVSGHQALTPKENAFAGFMLEEGIIGLGPKGFEPRSAITHVLGAAPGKKRTFAQNLRHERLHVFWDEDKALRTREEKAWGALPPAQQATEREALKNYAQDNEAQILEEWAVKRAEKSKMSIR